jgi:outer membrane protein assembly factor BamB
MFLSDGQHADRGLHVSRVVGRPSQSARDGALIRAVVGGGSDNESSVTVGRPLMLPIVPVTDGTYVYAINDRGIMYCLDAKTGKEMYGRQRLRPATYSGSPVLADGRIYITNEDGLTSVIKAGPVSEILAQNDFDDYTLSSPAVSEGQIFFRTAKFLYCIGKRTTGG